MDEPEATPPLTESARAVYDAARGVAGAWGEHLAALRELLLADLALARTAALRALLLLALAAIALGSCWALLTALCVWLLHEAGFGWGWALGLPLAVGALVGAVALGCALRLIRLANLKTSRTQLLALLERGNPPTQENPGRP